MRRSDTRLLNRSIAGLIVAVLGFVYLRTLAPGITWANSGADSGDLVTAAATMGVAHPTGYPTFLLLARLFQLIPVGDLAFRTNLLSATAATLAALCVYLLVRMLASQDWRSAVAAGIAALGLGLSAVFWSQAVVAEVYSLHALFTAVILLWTLHAIQHAGVAAHDGGIEARRYTHEKILPGSGSPWYQGLVVGLALGNHITIALVAAVWLLVVVVCDPAPARGRLLARRMLWVGIGALVYLYLPLRASAHPPINWGNPRDWEGFWWVISGRPYRQLAFGLPPVFVYGRVTAWAALLVQQFGWAGLGLGLLGLLYGAAGSRPFVWSTCGLAVVYSAFALGYDTADSYTYLIPVYLIFAIWIGLGVQVGLEALASWRPPVVPFAAALLIAALLWPVPATARQVDASDDRRAIDYAARVLAAAPAHALLVTASDRDTFALWYYHYALGERSDVFVIVEPLLEFDWYRDNLRAVYPTLQIPEHPSIAWVEAISIANRALGPVCRTNTDNEAAMICGPNMSAVSGRR